MGQKGLRALKVQNFRWLMSRKGFPLVELLVVIVVLAILVGIATPNILGILKENENKTTEIVKKNLEDAAVSYAKEQISLGKIKLSSCPKNVEVTVNNYSSYTSCAVKYTVKSLKDNGIFTDKSKSCNDNKSVVVYKFNNGSYDELRASLQDSICDVG